MPSTLLARWVSARVTEILYEANNRTYLTTRHINISDRKKRQSNILKWVLETKNFQSKVETQKEWRDIVTYHETYYMRRCCCVVVFLDVSWTSIIAAIGFLPDWKIQCLTTLSAPVLCTSLYLTVVCIFILCTQSWAVQSLDRHAVFTEFHSAFALFLLECFPSIFLSMTIFSNESCCKTCPNHFLCLCCDVACSNVLHHLVRFKFSHERFGGISDKESCTESCIFIDRTSRLQSHSVMFWRNDPVTLTFSPTCWLWTHNTRGCHRVLCHVWSKQNSLCRANSRTTKEQTELVKTLLTMAAVSV